MVVRKTAAVLFTVGVLAIVAAAPAPGSILRYEGEARAGGARVDFADATVELGHADAGVMSGQGDEAVHAPCEHQLACAIATGAEGMAAGEPVLTARVEADDDDRGPNEVTVAEVPEPLAPTVGGRAGHARAEVELFVPTRADAQTSGATLSLHAARTQVGGLLEEGGPTPLAEPEEGGPTPLAQVELGESRSTIIDDDGVTRSHATFDGGSVVIGHRPAVGGAGAPLAVIEVTPAEAQATADRREEVTAAEADAALARVRVADPEGDGHHEVELAPGDEPLVVGEGTPLETTIHPAATVTESTETAATASAEAVRIEAFQDPLPQAAIAVGAVRAGAGGESEGTPPLSDDGSAAAGEPQRVARQSEPTSGPQPASRGELPRTGGTATATGTMLVAVGIAAMGVVNWSRR